MEPADISVTSVGGPIALFSSNFTALYLELKNSIDKVSNIKVSSFFALYALVLTNFLLEVVCSNSLLWAPFALVI